jgi:hypothetical protein
MQNREIARQIQRICELQRRTSEACGENIEIQSDWAKYLCIIGAGLLENAIKELYSEYAAAQVSKPVANFVSATLDKIRNPKAQRFLEIAAAFNTNWKEELETFMQDQGRGDAIDSIINNRHKIAHGQERNSQVTVSQVKDWLSKVIEVLEFIENQCQR